MVNRRRFLQKAVSLGVGTVASGAGREVALVAMASDPVASAGPSQWALVQLEEALRSAGVTVVREVGGGTTFQVMVAGGGPSPQVPEGLALIPGRGSVRVYGRDPRGLVYGLLELADRVQNSDDPIAALSLPKAIVEQPANKVRSIARLFTSEVEDKPWFNDREMWPHYLTMLAAQRFNRFNLSFGIGYDFLTNVTDAYLLFAYPFLLNVPGYKVRVPQLPDSERDQNLAMLRTISELTTARGLDFQLGLWMHGYQWLKSPKPNYTIEGLTPETHGAYCRDAVRMLLKACPAISGVTFRVHGESGVEEGSYAFWKAVFEGVATCGRTVTIDMHPKGMNQEMLDLGIASGMPLQVSPKYWAEHMGMPYQQADIRDQERPVPGKQASALMKFSAGSRSFLRYGYGDLLREDRKWQVVTRIWPGTQRLLLWGDPVTAAAHSKTFGFCGSDGVDICEPLSFKGRRGTGVAGGRCAYRDKSLRPKWDWMKYEYTYRVWGRYLYNPAADPDGCDRYLRAQFGAGGAPAGEALASVSRILPIVTTAYMPSAANNNYWPEMYLTQSLVDAEHYQPYSDTTPPRVFQHASPLDPQLFSRMDEFAGELLSAQRSGKYSPVEVAQWIEDYAAAAGRTLVDAKARTKSGDRPEFRRLAIDVAIEAGLGQFFGAKFRAGVLYSIYQQTGSPAALDETVRAYRRARSAWADLAETARSAYLENITVGEHPQLHGNWSDRLGAMDEDINRVLAQTNKAKRGPSDPHVAAAIREALGRPQRALVNCRHQVPSAFRKGEPLRLSLGLDGSVASVRVYYRHVNHADRFETAEMESRGTDHSKLVPASYLDTVYPLQYYFEISRKDGSATLYPGFPKNLDGTPYFVVRRRF